MPRLGIRWTVGDVSDAGFDALRLSIRSAWNLFGPMAEYAVCVNGLFASAAAARTSATGCPVQWIQSSTRISPWLRNHVGAEMAEGVAWKLMPVRLFPDLHELSLDNDVILWSVPPAVEAWLAADDFCLLAEDVQPALGQFSELCGQRALNSGIRGLPPGFDMESELQSMLRRTGITLHSELDEQGLQAAVLLRQKLLVVSKSDVSICSPFPQHQKQLGRCGAHFVGLNVRQSPWMLDGRAAHEVIHERWNSFADELALRVL